MRNYLIYFTIAATLLIGCGKPEGTPVVPTKFDKLEFLIPNSDLIAIIQITDGIDPNKGRPPIKRYSVIASVKRVISGDSIPKQISITNASAFKNDNVVSDYMALYNGYHLAFLKKQDSFYKPVSRFAILEITHNRIHPIWKKDGTNTGMTSGYDLEEIIYEIMETISNQRLDLKEGN